MAFNTTPWQLIDETWDAIVEEWGAVVTGNALIGWENHIVDAAITASSETTAAPVSNLQNDHGASAWQTAAATTAHVDVDASAAVDWRMAGIFRSNLTSAATVRFKLGTTLGGSDVYDSTALTGIVPGYGQLTKDFGAVYAARYLRIEISDGANPDGFLKVGLAYAGTAFVAERNFSLGAATGRQRDLSEVIAKGGQEFPTLNYQRRMWTLAFDLLEEAEVYPELFELDRIAGAGGNVLLIPFPGSSWQQRMAVFGRLKNAGDFGLPTQDVYDWRFSVTERL